MDNGSLSRGYAPSSRYSTIRYQDQESERDPRSRRGTSQRIRSDSSDHGFSTRFSRIGSPNRGTIPSIVSRDYGDSNHPVSPAHSRPRNIDLTFAPSRIRRRLGSTTTSINPSPGVAQSWAGFGDMSTRTRSVAIAPTVSGRDMQDSRTFSLAGPAPVETLVANQPYVDPGYVQLNPAYDQPTNVRPVWSLAKPLPRVIRPGMVPSREEVQQELQEERHQEETGDLDDLESGRIEPSLQPGRIIDQLDTIRRERELSLFRSYRDLNRRDSPGFSPYAVGRRLSDPPEPSHLGDQDVIEEESEGHRPSEQARSDIEEFPQLREAISNVTQAKEEDELIASFQDAVPLPAYQAEDDEVHNLHTYWSVIRLRFREPMAEFLAVFILDTFGFSCNLAMTISHGAIGTSDMPNWAWGFSAMIAIYVAGGVSGAHMNPFMSLMLYVFRGFPLRKIPVFAVAQLLGAFTATLVTYGLFRRGLLGMTSGDFHYLQMQGLEMVEAAPFSRMEILRNFIMFPRQTWVDFPTAYFCEALGGLLIAVPILALGDDRNAPPGAGMGAFIIGLLIVLVSFAFGGVTGLNLNPVRDLGPRLAMTALGYGKDGSLFADGYWFKVAWLGPLTGIMLGGLMYDALIFIGGESPVNYPAPRIRRAARKWKKRWKARIARTKKAAKEIKMNATSGYEAIE
ncbi:hypothetical protein R6Q59_009973 [Mikania micrantha]